MTKTKEEIEKGCPFDENLINPNLGEKTSLEYFNEGTPFKFMVQTNSIESLINRNYEAQKKRGKDLSKNGCLNQINEEVSEFNEAIAYYTEKEQKDELADIILSCFTKANVMGWNVIEILSDKVDYNEKRED